MENFRALRDVRMQFDETTLLIGENGCGKSSLLKAVEVCLGRNAAPGEFPLSPRDFHRPRGGAPSATLSIDLDFAERHNANEESYPKLRRPEFLTPNGWIEISLKVRAQRTSDTQPPDVSYSIVGPGGPTDKPAEQPVGPPEH